MDVGSNNARRRTDGEASRNTKAQNRMNTELLTTGTQSRTARHDGTLSFRCADCGAVSPCQTWGGTGYAVRPDDSLICYPCADKAQREELRDRSKPFCAYVSGDGRRVTTWTGGTLGAVVRSSPCRLTRRSYTHGKSFASFRVRDVHGANWIGRGSPGIAIRLHPVA